MNTEIQQEWKRYDYALNQILQAALAAGKSEAEAAALARTSQDYVTRRLGNDHFVQQLEARRLWIGLVAPLWRQDPVGFLKFVDEGTSSSSPELRRVALEMQLDWFMDQPDEEGRLQAIGVWLSAHHSDGRTVLPGSDQE